MLKCFLLSVASARLSGQEDFQRGTPPVSLASCSISTFLRACIITECSSKDHETDSTGTSILIPLLLNFNMRLHGNPTAWCLFWLQRMPVIPGMYGMHYRLKIRRLKCDSTANGCIEKTRVLIKGKETLRSYAVNHGNKLCHPPHDDERQQLQQQQYIKPQPGTQQQAGIYEYILERRAAAKSI